MFTDQFFTDQLLRILLLGPLSLLWITLVVRMIGLRSFSKMTAIDFITTIATGSLLASAAGADTWPVFFQTSGAVFALLGAQALIAQLRLGSSKVVAFLENEPLVLVRDGMWKEDNLRKSRVKKEDVYAKLREANVLSFSEVRAVVLETTGDISVLHGEALDEELLEPVRES
ncbi:DUF421 domain-containing protein [Luteolibacter algae]|uniref:DUF421 domain-containing protein n=1 Tax=Luteolibacter algae TaxID=454151 RepID=A0ABW5D4W4_9BACT